MKTGDWVWPERQNRRVTREISNWSTAPNVSWRLNKIRAKPTAGD